MDDQAAHLLLNIKTRNPIELRDFVSGFVALGNQYEKFVAQARPDLKTEASIFVKEVRHGSIEAELIGFVGVGVNTMLTQMDKLLIFEQFVKLYKDRISLYFKPGGRDQDANKGDLADFNRTVAAIAHDPNAKATLSAAYYEDGKRKIREAFVFDTPQAKQAESQILEHKLEIEQRTGSDYPRVLMMFVRSSIQDVQTGKRSGELVVIPTIHPKPLPLVYASELAEQRIKHEIKEADDNVYKKGFEVAVNVEMIGDRVIAYRVRDVHDVIDLPDEDAA
jgi:hypothetical protein